MVREFSKSGLAIEEANVLRYRHAHHFVRRLKEVGKLSSIASFLPEAEFEIEVNSMRATLHFALEISDATLAHQIAQVMGIYWEVHGLLEEGSRSLKAVISLPCKDDDPLPIDTLHSAANLAWMQQDLKAAHAYTSQALAIAFRCDNTYTKVTLLNLQARIYLEEERYEDADRVLIEGIQLEDALYRHEVTPFMLIQRGEAALAQDRLDFAEELLLRGLSSTTPENFMPYCIGWNNLAEVALRRGDVRGAREALKHVLPLAQMHARREAIFMNSIAELLLLGRASKGRDVEMALRLISYISAACERSGITLSPMIQKQMKERLYQTQRQIPSDRWQSLWDEGLHWTVEKAFSATSYILEDN
jgi:ATP/maltotriose-dependent transcriptional regulator MalT